jgi:peptidoglycan/xylan/chitin deacetylase (PgdA/CDA1 family)
MAQEVLHYKPKNLLVLNYHKISVAKNEKDPYAISLKNFTEHLSVIRAMGHPVVSLSDPWSSNSGFAVALTFDDGHLSDSQQVAPLLAEYGYTATFFSVADWIGREDRTSSYDLRNFIAAGHTIGAHGISNRPFSELSIEELRDEVNIPKTIIQQMTGHEITLLAAPFGRTNEKVTDLARMAGYKHLFVTGLKINSSRYNPFEMHRWNITSKTTTAQLTTILKQRSVPGNIRVVQAGKQLAKKFIGVRMADMISAIF